MSVARSLADRLAAKRLERPSGLGPISAAAHIDDRAATLARWFGARLELTDGGAAIVVERTVPMTSDDAVALEGLPSAVYFDTETTGLSTGAGTVPFLAGVGHLQGGAIIVRQLLLPDYPHERAMLRRLCAELAWPQRLVTYNGRSFDMPLLVSRLTVHGFFAEQAALPARHDDLLPIARRLWRRTLGSARLADVEAAVLGVRRVHDCPSSEVPARYFGYLRGGSPELLAAVLDHNLQDIVSLALLEATIARLRAGAWRDAALLDHRGMGLDLLRLGDATGALQVVARALAAADRADAPGLRRFASRLMLATGDLLGAEELWRSGTRAASVDAAGAWIEVARIRERYRRDLCGALEAASAASRVLDLSFALGRGGGINELGAMRVRVDRRLRRLRRWVAADARRRSPDREGRAA
ncbi:MAG: ribonuclease H-like domain-containing protein [Chloroflexota bacterium]|nr:ribonuclease H-like domain-containing protein [Chloroflexota bacterium]